MKNANYMTRRGKYTFKYYDACSRLASKITKRSFGNKVMGELIKVLGKSQVEREGLSLPEIEWP